MQISLSLCPSEPLCYFFTQRGKEKIRRNAISLRLYTLAPLCEMFALRAIFTLRAIFAKIKLNKEQKVKVSDTTADAMKNQCW